MPEKFADYWWEEMPPKAIKAAKALGYDQEKWDNDYEVPYDGKTFQQATAGEKHAAMFLGMSPIHKKLNVWWDDLDKKTKDAAEVLGWTKEKWDDDWDVTDLPCEEWSWDDMTKKQKDAANHFGYSKATWDETFEEEEFTAVCNEKDEFRDVFQFLSHKKTSFLLSHRPVHNRNPSLRLIRPRQRALKSPPPRRRQQRRTKMKSRPAFGASLTKFACTHLALLSPTEPPSAL
jgi:hypothetical protein